MAYAHNINNQGDKFSPRSRKCVFLGHPVGKKGWTLFDLEKETIFISRDVVFCEDKFPFSNFLTTPELATPDVSLETREISVDASGSESVVSATEAMGTETLILTSLVPETATPCAET